MKRVSQLTALALLMGLAASTTCAAETMPALTLFAARLKQTGFTRLSTLSDALSQTDRLQKLPHFEQLVYPQWLHDLQQGKAVAAAPAGDWKVFEAAWGAPKLYLLSHIPGAGYIDTNEVESEPLWNKVSDAQLKAMLAKHGIRHDTTVILYGRDVYAAARVAQIMLYAGVKDVRLLDGGWQTWSDAGLPVERGMPPAQQPAPDFGAPIPGQPQLMLDTEQARGLLHRQDASLVSVRSWPEFIGTTSGYSYIKPKGDIAGARWGHAGSDSTHMEDFHNPDGTMRSADDIAEGLVATADARRRRQPAQRAKQPRQPGEMRRKQAAKDKQQDGLRPLRQSPEIVQRFMGVAGIGDLVPGRQGGKSEKAAAGADKGKQQPAARQGIVQRIRQNKAERHQGVKEKIQRNIEKAARVREPAPPRQSAVQAIQQAVKENGRQRRAIPPQRQKGQSQHADGKTDQRQPVR